MVTYVKNTRILPSIKTDHNIIELSFKIDGPKRGSGFWKLNTSVLEDELYVSEIKTLIEKVWKDTNNMQNLNTRYDWLKYNIRKHTINYCKQRAKLKALKENKILEDVQLLEVNICSETASDEELNKYQTLKNELEQIEEERARGFWIRSGLERIENDEKSTCFFLNKAKTNFQKKTVSNIKLDSGVEITNQKDILNELKSFYQNLYTSTYESEGVYRAYEISDDDVPVKCTDEQKIACEGSITLNECTEAIKTFKKHKSPGCDGIPAEFYLYFWPEIGPKLVDSLNYSCKNGLLLLSQRRAIITLLKKKGKDNSKVKNWRPVALLNTDYKIFTKVLARRLEKNIPSIIHADQSGFVNRFIGESVRFTQDIIEQFDIEKKTGILLQLDFQKAFDSVEWHFLFKVLHKFNVGEQFISYVKCCYISIYSCVNNNGFSTEWFQLFRGMRQGCPLSCLLLFFVRKL